MNFWDAQAYSKRMTFIYVLLFAFLTLATAVGSEYGFRLLLDDDYAGQIPWVAIGFLSLSLGVAGYHYAMFRQQGGAFVARAAGALPVPRDPSDLKLRQLRNIVEETAVASSLPIPEIFVLDNTSINAFAAGLSNDKAAVTVTTGTLNLLNRDELQGVIAHEMGHIANQDMKIATRLGVLVAGFFVIIVLALRVLQFVPRGRDNRANASVLAAFILMIAGFIAWFGGSLLQAFVSRQREYLADASSVQYTRNPEGLIRALQKIEKESLQSQPMPKQTMAYSHLYFSSGSLLGNLWATHPPLDERIARIRSMM